MSYKSAWIPPFGRALNQALGALTKNQRLEFGIAAEGGHFEVDYAGGAPTVNTFKTTRALAAFIIRLLAHFQGLGTVSVIDYKNHPGEIRLHGLRAHLQGVCSPTGDSHR